MYFIIFNIVVKRIPAACLFIHTVLLLPFITVPLCITHTEFYITRKLLCLDRRTVITWESSTWGARNTD